MTEEQLEAEFFYDVQSNESKLTLAAAAAILGEGMAKIAFRERKRSL